MELSSEGEVRLHRAMLNQALQVCPLRLPETSVCILWLFVLFVLKMLFPVQESLDDLMVTKRWYSDREDFTVVMQGSPFITDTASVSVSDQWTVSTSPVQSQSLHIFHHPVILTGTEA